MSEWFHAKVKFLRQMDNGLVKQISEQYLVDSMSFTECESRVGQEVGEGMREVTMMAIARSPIKEVVFYGDTDLWFKCKVTYSIMDEDTEKEKKVTIYLLVNASDAKEAYERTEEHLKEMLVPFSIPKLEQSPIVDVYQYAQGLRPSLRHVEQKGEDLRNEAQQKADALEEKHLGHKSPIEHDPEREMSCAYTKKDQVGKRHPRSQDDEKPQHFDESPFYKSPTPPGISGNGLDSIDPTDGKPHSFEPDPLWTFMADLGVTLLESEQHEVYGMCESCGMVEFIEWLQSEHDMNTVDAAKVYEFLEGLKEEV